MQKTLNIKVDITSSLGEIYVSEIDNTKPDREVSIGRITDSFDYESYKSDAVNYKSYYDVINKIYRSIIKTLSDMIKYETIVEDFIALVKVDNLSQIAFDMIFKKTNRDFIISKSLIKNDRLQTEVSFNIEYNTIVVVQIKEYINFTIDYL
jgi:hypothetical protein